MLDLRLLQLSEELPGVGGERFDVAPLALSVNRIESEGTFARATRPGTHRHRLARDRDVDVLEIVLLRALDGDLAHRLVGDGLAVSRTVRARLSRNAV